MPTTLAGQLPVSVKLVHEEAFEVVNMLRSQSLLNLLDDKQSLHYIFVLLLQMYIYI
jgi:hypothetical protein